MKPASPTHFQCPSCGYVTTSEYARALWCTHQPGSFQFSPPEWSDSAWTRMVKITKIEAEQPVEVPWVVVEYQNPHGWVQDDYHDALPGDPDRSWSHRIVSEPMPRDEAYAEADKHPRRPGWPHHMHGFRAFPIDIAEEW